MPRHRSAKGNSSSNRSGLRGACRTGTRHRRFPQVCVRADRRSAIRSHGLSAREALIQECYNGREALMQDGIAGASRCEAGLGRHGDFVKIR
jgi:hypothetical protein